MTKDPNKHQFNDDTGTGWKRDTNYESPTYGKWIQYKKWKKIGVVDSLNPFTPLVSGARNIASKLNKLRINQIARTQARNKLMIDQGYVRNNRGYWIKPNRPFDNEEILEAVDENIVEEEEDKKIVVPPSPVDIAAVKEYTENKGDDGYTKTQNFVSGQPISNDAYQNLSNITSQAVSNVSDLLINKEEANNNTPVAEVKPKKTGGTMYGLLISEWRKANKDQKRRAKGLSGGNSRATIRGDGKIGPRNSGLNPGGRPSVRINKGNTNSAWYMSS